MSPTSVGHTSATSFQANMGSLSMLPTDFMLNYILAFQVHQCEENVNQPSLRWNKHLRYLYIRYLPI